MPTVLYSAGLKPSPSIKSYSTNFPLTENPISEGAVWVSGGISSPRTNVQTANNHAYATMSSFDGTNFDDSIAVLAQGYSANQSCQGTIWNTGAINGQEVELVLRGNIAATSNTGYEVDLVIQGGTAALVSWNGPANIFTQLVANTATNVSLNDGDVWLAQMIGPLITVKCNTNIVFTYDTSGDAFRILSGSPGMGFWNQTGSSANSPNFGWKHWQATEL